MITELKVLFYSPVAWLILIIFALQAGIEFSEGMADELRSMALGHTPYSPTARMFGGGSGVISMMLENLYLYIPLLTMGLMSRELSSGSIKLLYSSPVSNIQIIVGKYLSALVYGFIFIIILLLEVALMCVVVKDVDIMMLLVALLGMYLTVCAYIAIGLFMSTITHYQVVAAIGALVVLALLNFIGSVGQDIDFVRDITYWLSIAGRSKTFLMGMINSADVLYFLMVIFFFLTLSVIKLHGERSKSSAAGTTAKYGTVLIIVLALGYITSRPTMVHYYDGTQTKSNTLMPESQQVVAQLEGGLTLTTYVNILESNYYIGMPESRNRDLQRFEEYIRFKPEIKIKYVYYYHKADFPFLDERYPDLNDRERLEKLCELNDYDIDDYLPYEEVAKSIDLSGEHYRFVRVFERENGQRVFLRLFEDNQRHPTENEISTALKTLIAAQPRVGFVTGHGERSIQNMGVRGYGIFATDNTFRHALINQGFTVEELSLEAPVTPEVGILVISDMRQPYTEAEMKNYTDFLARGGNLIILGESKRQQNMNPLIAPMGLRFTDDVLVRPTKEFLADLMVGQFTPQFGELSPSIKRAIRYGNCFASESVCGIEQLADTGFKAVDIVVSDSTGVWNERQTTNFIDEVPTCDPSTGEIERSYSIAKYLTRAVNGQEQRIFVISDADCFSSSELTQNRAGINAANFTLIQQMFRMMSYGEFPLGASRVRPPDDKIYLDQSDELWIRVVYIGLIPAALLTLSLVIWLRRRKW